MKLRPKYRFTILFFIVGVCCSIAVDSLANCDTSAILGKIERYIESIEDYQVQSKIFLDGTHVRSDISGKVPNLMCIKMNIEQGSSSVNVTTIFDGTYQWIETKYPTAIEVLKIKLAGLVSRDRPFDTSYYLMGSGLLNGEDYPTTISTFLSVYDVKAICTQSEIKFAGLLNVDSFTKYALSQKTPGSAERRVEQYSELFKKLQMVFDAKTLELKEYHLGTEDKPKRFTSSFSNHLVNQKLTNENFIYVLREGANPIDITGDVHRQFKQK